MYRRTTKAQAARSAQLEAEREETKRWRNAAKLEQEIRKQAEMIADKAVTEHEEKVLSELIPQPVERKPMTDVESYALAATIFEQRGAIDRALELIAAVERHHGIRKDGPC